jgi:hypothetical protein
MFDNLIDRKICQDYFMAYVFQGNSSLYKYR